MKTYPLKPLLDRRDVLRSLWACSLTAACGSRLALASAALDLGAPDPTPGDVDRLIAQRLATPATAAGFTDLPGIPCETRLALAAVLADGTALVELNTWRARGLNRLKTADLPPRVKLLMLDLRLEDAMHEVATCLDHFLGVYDLLKSWGHDDALAYTGLLHAIYGTEFNQIQLLSPTSAGDRAAVARVTGAAPEALIHLYGTVCTEDFLWQVHTSGRPAASAFDLSLGARVDLDAAAFLALAETLVANSYEPYCATGVKEVLSRLAQFDGLRPYLSAGANAALDARATVLGDHTVFVPTPPGSCQYFVPPPFPGVDVTPCHAGH